MPHYDLICKKCKKEKDNYFKLMGDPMPVCECGQVFENNWASYSNGNYNVAHTGVNDSFTPFYDTSMKGSDNPIHIDSVKTWDKELKKNHCCLGPGATKTQLRKMKKEINDRAAANRAAKQ
jgi:hypothetical protein